MTIPKEAWPVVEEIRRHVPRPEELPTPRMEEYNIPDPCLVWEHDGKDAKCPMGLLSYALVDRPNSALDFDVECSFNDEQIRKFWTWWDTQKDAKEAVAEVWEKTLSE